MRTTRKTYLWLLVTLLGSVFFFTPLGSDKSAENNFLGAQTASCQDTPQDPGTIVTADGSCAPRTGWVCGLNGQNYDNKEYIAAQ